MTEEAKESTALRRLLKIARAQADVAAGRIVDLTHAIEASTAALDRLDANAARETAASPIGPGDFLTAALSKRSAIEATRRRLENELAAAREHAADAYAEMKKFEFMVEATAERARRRRVNAALREMDDAAGGRKPL